MSERTNVRTYLGTEQCQKTVALLLSYNFPLGFGLDSRSLTSSVLVQARSFRGW